MALVIETEKYRNKENKDIIITLLKINAVDEDYKEPAYIYKTDDLYAGWQVSLNENFLNDWEKINE